MNIQISGKMDSHPLFKARGRTQSSHKQLEYYLLNDYIPSFHCCSNINGLKWTNWCVLPIYRLKFCIQTSAPTGRELKKKSNGISCLKFQSKMNAEVYEDISFHELYKSDLNYDYFYHSCSFYVLLSPRDN